MKTTALILAAGRGRRAGAGLPKTYRELAGKTVLRHAIDAFLPNIDTVQIVIHHDDMALYEAAIGGLDLPPPVFGGETRAESVARGLKAAKGDLVLIHDGARPFLSAKTIQQVIAKLSEADGVIPALPVTDALWQVEGSELKKPVPREHLVRAQTPQGFWLEKYRDLPAQYPNALDDAEVALAAGLKLAWVEGAAANTKLTYPEDFT